MSHISAIRALDSPEWAVRIGAAPSSTLIRDSPGIALAEPVE
ncbi:hypothetical protein [Pandoraea sp.]